MRVHVVVTGLGIVFGNENDGFVPERRMADGVDDLAERVVVIRNERIGVPVVGAASRRAV